MSTKFIELSYSQKVLEVNIFEFIKSFTDALKSHNFTDKDEIHLYICIEPYKLQIQNLEKKFNLYEEKNYKVGKFKMSDIFSQLPRQQVFFMKHILPKIAELRAALKEC